MHRGDSVIADHPDSKSNMLIRSYGIVKEFTKAGNVIIEMADGSKIERNTSSIAVYVRPPSNWEKLFQQQVTFSQPRQRMLSSNSRAGHRHP